jgi:diguanylate cyclase (GGDEF)-like protein/PAS domain S-box-containing protein
MKISRSYKLFAVVFTVFLLILGVVIYYTLTIQENIVRSEERRFRSFMLANELIQSSEELSRMARSYVATGDSTYEKSYGEILDVRSGKLPRPSSFSVTYWYLAGLGEGRIIASGEAMGLLELIRREGITEQEFAKLKESKINSDRLMTIEKKAFAAMNGFYEDDRGQFSVRKKPDRAYAVNLLFSDQYTNEKAKILVPIQQFIQALEKRVKTELRINELELRRAILITLGLIVIALGCVVIIIIHAFSRILHPIDLLRSQVAEIAKGNYNARCDVSSANEIGELCAHFNIMATSLQTDIAKRAEAEETLKKSEGQVRLLLNSTGEAIYGIDHTGNCTFANPTCVAVLGYSSPEMLLGKNMHALIHHSYEDGRPMPVEDCKIFEAFRKSTGIYVDDEVFWRADNTSIHVEYRSFPQSDNGTVYGAVVTFHDITERKKSEEKIRHMATHDGLTDLPSMRLAREHLSMAKNMALRYNNLAAVMFVDLDGFKAINDGFGHDAGDKVLREAAKRLSASVRKTDTVARVGGDEFLLIITELRSQENAANIAEKVIRFISQPVIYKNRLMKVGVSVGIAIFPRDTEDIDQLVKLADHAMYKVKNAGKNGYAFVKSVPVLR